ncbi:MAG TPA: hypothetical protein VFT55_05300 [Planctomycetota bacterium]|nr:hypothetical protein [Planctomycetota bacterium]
MLRLVSALLPYACVPLLAGTPATQEPEARPAPSTVVRPQPVTVTLGQPFSLPPGEHDLVDLVAKAAAILGRNILWPDTERQAAKGQGLSVFLNNPIKLTPPAFEELLANLLYTRGFAIVPVDPEKGFYEVLYLHGPRQRELMNRAQWRTPEEVLARPNQREYVLTSVCLKHINATVCTNALRPFFAMGGGGNNIGSQLGIGNVGNQEAMVLAGFTDQLCAALRLIRECDQPMTQPPDPNMPGAPNPYPQMQAQIKALQDQVAELQKAIGLKK